MLAAIHAAAQAQNARLLAGLDSHCDPKMALADSGRAQKQDVIAAVDAAESLRAPWWLHLAVILRARRRGALAANWITLHADQAAYQVQAQNQKLIDEGRMLERVWPNLTPAEQKKLERLDQP